MSWSSEAGQIRGLGYMKDVVKPDSAQWRAASTGRDCCTQPYREAESCFLLPGEDTQCSELTGQEGTFCFVELPTRGGRDAKARLKWVEKENLYPWRHSMLIFKAMRKLIFKQRNYNLLILNTDMILVSSSTHDLIKHILKTTMIHWL